MDAISVICLDFKNSFDNADLIIIIRLDLKTYLSIHHENRTVPPKESFLRGINDNSSLA